MGLYDDIKSSLDEVRDPFDNHLGKVLRYLEGGERIDDIPIAPQEVTTSQIGEENYL
ncbi:MAG: hypothetical protein V1804_02150 [Patescibacteria group bacterium]